MTEDSNTEIPQDSDLLKQQDSNAEKPPEDNRMARCEINFVLIEGNNYCSQMNIALKDLNSFNFNLSQGLIKAAEGNVLALNGSLKSPHDFTQIPARNVVMLHLKVLEIYEKDEHFTPGPGG